MFLSKSSFQFRIFQIDLIERMLRIEKIWYYIGWYRDFSIRKVKFVLKPDTRRLKR